MRDSTTAFVPNFPTGDSLMSDNQNRDDVLRRMLKTPPTPHKPSGKLEKVKDADPIPIDSPESLVKWGKRNIQKD